VREVEKALAVIQKDLCDSYMVARPFQNEEDLLVHRSVVFPQALWYLKDYYVFRCAQPEKIPDLHCYLTNFASASEKK
jgi:hypothetical protein